MSDREISEDRCGFVLEPEDVNEEVAEDFEAGSDEWYLNSEAVCCWRQVWNGAEDGRCIWHTEREDKPADSLIEARADGWEVLNGAYVPAVKLGNRIDFEACRLWAATFQGAALQGASFAQIVGPYAQFPGANLETTQFSDATLPGAQFPDANLNEAEFPNADLIEAQFPNADLTAAKFLNTDLTEACFPNAKLYATSLLNVDLYNAQFPNTDLRLAEFTNANLQMAEFFNANLRRAGFPESDLWRAQFSGVEARRVQITNAEVQRAEFTDANLRRAMFTDADVSGAQFDNANLDETDFSDTDSTAASFTGATLERANLSGADVAAADLTDARLHDAHLLDVHINGGTNFGSVVPEEADAEWFDGSPFAIRARLRWWLALLRLDADDRADRSDQLSNARTVYRTIQRLYRENSMPRRIDSYYVRARDTRRKQAIIDGDLPRWLYLAAQRWVMGYGEKPHRVVATSGLVILGCAVAYPLVGGVTETSTVGGTPHYFAVPLPDVLPAWVGLPGAVETVLTSLYFSVVTFTTLGYGDLRPRTGAAQFLATFESLVGAFLLALLVYVLGRRATR